MIAGFFRWFYRLAWLIAGLGFATLALYVTLGRHYVSYIEMYADELVMQIEKASGQPVTVENLISRWDGLSPQLQLFGIRFGGNDPAGRPAVTAAYGSVKLSLLASAIRMRPEISEIALNDVRVSLVENESGKWGLASISGGSGGGMPDWLLDSVLSVRSADLTGISADLFYTDGSVNSLALTRVRLRGDGVYLRVAANLISGNRGPLEIILESRGHPLQDRSYELDGYLHFDNTNFTAVTPILPDRYRPLAEIDLDGELWLRWRAGDTTHFSGHLAASSLPLGALWKLPEQKLEGLSLLFAGQGAGDDWEFWLPRLEGNWAGHDLNLNGLEARVDDGVHVSVRIPDLDLAAPVSILSDGPGVTDALKGIVRDLNPSGRIHDAHLRLSYEAGEISNVRLNTGIESLSLSAFSGVPEIRGLSGVFKGGLEGGRLLIDSQKNSLRFPGLYDKALSFDHMSGLLDWRIEDETLFIHSNAMDLGDGDIDAAAAFDLYLPLKKGMRAPEMNLLVGLRNATVAIREKYVPTGLSQGLRDWLEKALKSGNIPEVGFVYRGSIRPGDEINRTIQLFLEVEDLSLAFSPDWPALNRANAFLALDDGDTIVDVSSAVLGRDLRTKGLQAVIYEGDLGSRLEVKGDVGGSISGAFELVKDSVLREYTAGIFDRWRGEGAFDVSVKLDMPLSEKDQRFEPDIKVQLQASKVRVPDYRVNFTDLQGRFYYNERGFYSRRTSMQLFGRPLDIDVLQNKDGRVTMRSQGSIAVSELQQWSGQGALGLIDGVVPFSFLVATGGSETAVLSGDINLKTASVDAPPPLGKTKGQPGKLKFRMPLEGDNRQLHLELEGVAQADVDIEGGLSAADIRIGQAQAQPLQPGRARIAGSLTAVELQQWLDTWGRYRKLTESAAKAGESNPGPVLLVDALAIKTLRYQQEQLSAVTLTASNGDVSGDWVVAISSDKVTGKARLPLDESKAIVVNLEHLLLPAPEPESAEPPVAAGQVTVAAEKKPSLFASIKPETLPDLDVDIANLQFGEEQWGSLGFDLRGAEESLLLDRIRGELRGVQLGNGDSTRMEWKLGEGEHTRVIAGLNIADTGWVMERWGFPRAIESKDARIGADLQWPGKPDEGGLLSMSGFTDVRMRKGRIPDSPDTASNALKVVGVFNLTNLFRRMQFDFSDLFEKGVHFDSVKGRIIWDKGVMKLPEQLVIDGPSSEFAISGWLDFNTDIVDMELAASLPVASNLPWVAALVGGLPVAAGVYVASKIFESQMKRFSSAVYGISGVWRDPQVKFLRVFDDRKKKETK